MKVLDFIKNRLARNAFVDVMCEQLKNERDSALQELQTNGSELAAMKNRLVEIEDMMYKDGFPSFLREFDKLYDEATGGWLAPGVFDAQTRYSPEIVGTWKHEFSQQYPSSVNYGPVELEVAHFYYWFCRLVRPQLILETGTHFGYSTAALASALQRYSANGKVLTIDVVEQHHVFRETSLARSIIFTLGNSLEVPIDAESKFDMLVLDSDHTYGTIMREIIRFEKILRIQGYILMHDAKFYDGVGLAVKEVMKNPRFEVVNLDTPRRHGVNSRPPGITMIRKLSDDTASYPLCNDEKLAQIEVNLDRTRDILSPALLDLMASREGGD